jgi:phosphoenolpyruvate carboxykinase (ATP)
MLGERLKKNNVKVWLINTGWTGGAYGKGHRMKLAYTRAMISAALEGDLDNVQYETHPVFGVAVPVSCPGVPENILNPRNTWTDGEAYDKAAENLAKQFITNFEKYASGITEEVIAAGPKI